MFSALDRVNMVKRYTSVGIAPLCQSFIILIYSFFSRNPHLQSLPFIVDAYTDKCKSHIRALPLQGGGAALERAVCEAVRTSGEERIKIKEAVDAVMHTSVSDSIFTITVENKVQTLSDLEYSHYCS